MTDSERLKILINHFNMSVNAFSNLIGLKKPQNLYDVLNGRNGISKALAEKITAKCGNVNLAWLLTGEGDMLKDEEFFEEQDMLPSIERERFVELGGEAFAEKLLDLFKKGEIFPASIVEKQGNLIQELFFKIGKLEAIIEMLKGKSPEEIME